MYEIITLDNIPSIVLVIVMNTAISCSSPSQTDSPAAKSVCDISLKAIDGKDIDLKDFK